MWLEYAPKTLMWELGSSLQRCFDLRRMMCIIIDHGDSVERSFLFETTFRAVEGEESLLDRLHRNIIIFCSGDG